MFYPTEYELIKPKIIQATPRQNSFRASAAKFLIRTSSLISNAPIDIMLIWALQSSNPKLYQLGKKRLATNKIETIATSRKFKTATPTVVETTKAYADQNVEITTQYKEDDMARISDIQWL